MYRAHTSPFGRAAASYLPSANGASLPLAICVASVRAFFSSARVSTLAHECGRVISAFACSLSDTPRPRAPFGARASLGSSPHPTVCTCVGCCVGCVIGRPFRVYADSLD